MRCAYPLLAQAADVRWGVKYLGVSVPYSISEAFS
jgi:hypothetical protein